jgi:rRNA small subunit pseudouridine methyltransferase Nep1
VDFYRLVKILPTVTLIIAETALETVPKEIIKHNSVIRSAARRGVQASRLLLDRSEHHSAMNRLKEQEKRGRPDIPYHILLDVSSTPIFKSGLLRLVFHTLNDKIVTVANAIRPPRSYPRYESLMMQLFAEGEVGGGLLKIEDLGLDSFVAKLRPGKVIGLTRLGEFRPLRDIVDDVSKVDNPVFVVGGFPRGHFKEKTAKLFDVTYSISKLSLDASLVVNRLVYELELNSNIAAALSRLEAVGAS